MNVNFTVFIDKILSGEKRQTIRRASPKWANVKAGDKLTLYTGLRTKECRKLGEAVVKNVIPVIFIPCGNGFRIYSVLGGFVWSKDNVMDLARRDGFESVDDFYKFFIEHYGDSLDGMVIIRWENFKEAEDEH